MSTSYIGEIRVVGFTFPPVGWATCNGQSLPINENEILFSLIGTTYGGDGVSSFNVPNLSGRIAPAAGNGTGLSNYPLGVQGGTENVLLNAGQLPVHAHPFSAPLAASTSAGTTDDPVGNLPGVLSNGYATSPTAGVNLASVAVSGTTQPMSGNQSHPNLQPSLALNYIICTSGAYPPRPQ